MIIAWSRAQRRPTTMYDPAGLVFGSIADAHHNFDVEGVGGVIFGGVATGVTAIYNEAGVGGVIFGSVATAGLVFSVSGIGGVIFGGRAGIALSIPRHIAILGNEAIYEILGNVELYNLLGNIADYTIFGDGT